MTTTERKSRSRRAPQRPPDGGIDQDQPFDLYITPGYMIRRLHQIVVSLCHDYWADLNLTPVQYAGLQGIRAHPGIDQRGLARLIAFDRSTTGMVVEHLERRGLITRRVSRRDKRNKELYLTQSGAALLRRAQPVAWQIQDRLFQPLTEGDREKFVQLLGVLVEANNELSRAPLDPRGVHASDNGDAAIGSEADDK